MDKVVTISNFKTGFLDKIFNYFFTKTLFVKNTIKFKNTDKKFVYVDDSDNKIIDFSDFTIKQDDEGKEIIETSIETI